MEMTYKPILFLHTIFQDGAGQAGGNGGEAVVQQGQPPDLPAVPAHLEQPNPDS